MNTGGSLEEVTQAKADLLGSSTDAAILSDCGRQEAETFVTEKGPQFHAAFSITSQLDGQRAQRKPDRFKFRDPLRIHTNQFYRVIELYRQNVARNNVLPPDFDIRGRHTWDEVFRAAHDANNYSNDTKGIKGWAKKLCRGTEGAAPYIQPMLEILPNGDYTGALCGGLKIAFGVAAKRKEKREAIVEGFKRIPHTIEKAEHCRERHPDDETLYDLASELYLAILNAITGMIKWLVGDSFWKKNWTALSQSLKDKPIDVGLSEVLDCTLKLLYQAEKLQSDANVETNLMVKETQTEIKETTSIVNETQSTAQKIDISTRNIEEQTTAILPLTSDIDLKVSRLLSLTEQKDEVAVVARKNMEGVVQDGLRTAIWKIRRQKLKQEQQMVKDEMKLLHEEKLRIREKEMQLYEKESHISQAEARFYKQSAQQVSQQPTQVLDRLTSLLAVASEMHLQDLELIAAKGSNGPSTLHTQGYWLLRNKKFQAWLNSDDTRGLLVNEKSQSLDRMSTMSFACVTLIRGLLESQEATTISFFCSLHAKDRTSAEGPQGLVRSLISQLLLTQQFDLSFIDNDYMDDLRHHGIDFLCDLFFKLVQQLREDSVLFCVIDSVSIFEKSKYGDDMLLIANMLSRLTDTLSSPGAPILKVLMTTSRSTKSIRSCFSLVNSITVPLEASDGRDISGTYLIRHARKVLESSKKGVQQSLQQETSDTEIRGEAPLDLLEGIPSDSGEEQ